MKATVDWYGKALRVDFSAPKFLSIPLDPQGRQPRFFSERPAAVMPLRCGEFVGDMSQGAICNADVIEFSPHSHGTHTECIGHIRAQRDAVTETIDPRPALMRLITVKPDDRSDRLEIPAEALADLSDFEGTAVAIRTLPNEPSKQWRDYDENPVFPVLSYQAISLLSGLSLLHLLVDGPSLDHSNSKELENHAAWWGLRENVTCGVENPARRSVTEMIYAPDDVRDGDYWLQLELAHFISDAVPSRPVIYPAYYDREESA